MDFVVREARAVVSGPMAIVRFGTCGGLQADVAPGSVVVSGKGSVAVVRDPDAFFDDADASARCYRVSRVVPADASLSDAVRRLCVRLLLLLWRVAYATVTHSLLLMLMASCPMRGRAAPHDDAKPRRCVPDARSNRRCTTSAVSGTAAAAAHGRLQRPQRHRVLVLQLTRCARVHAFVCACLPILELAVRHQCIRSLSRHLSLIPTRTDTLMGCRTHRRGVRRPQRARAGAVARAAPSAAHARDGDVPPVRRLSVLPHCVAIQRASGARPNRQS